MLYLLVGPIVWAAHLTAIYGAHAALCALGAAKLANSDVEIPTFVTAVATIAALALLAAAVLAPETLARIIRTGDWPAPERSFHRRVMILLSLLSAFGIVLAGATAAVIPACAPLR